MQPFSPEPKNLVHQGRKEEDRAAEYLIDHGFTVITRRYKVKRGELDLVCLDGDTLVFVEVKSRRVQGYLPEDSIGPEKAKSLQSAASKYQESVGDNRPYRFDLICIDRNGLRHHRNFLAEG